MITVQKRDPQESNESLIRRFSRRVLQSGVVKEARSSRYHKKEISKNERRRNALVAQQFRDRRAERMKKGQI
jgi:ribosomal protein S21